MIKKTTSTILLLISFFTYSNVTVSAATVKHKTTRPAVLQVGIQKDVKREMAKKKKYNEVIIEDELVKELAKNDSKKQKKKYKKALISDEEVLLTEENKKFKRPVYTGKVKTENGLEVVLKPVEKIKTKNSYLKVRQEKKVDKYKVPMPLIGERVAFRVVNDVKKDEKTIIAKNTVVYAKIGEVSPRAMGGAPAEMTIENFEMMDKKGNLVPLDGAISSSGYSLSFWIGLAELATTPFLFGLAVPLLRVLPGGQAVVSPRKNYVVYY